MEERCRRAVSKSSYVHGIQHSKKNCYSLSLYRDKRYTADSGTPPFRLSFNIICFLINFAHLFVWPCHRWLQETLVFSQVNVPRRVSLCRGNGQFPFWLHNKASTAQKFVHCSMAKGRRPTTNQSCLVVRPVNAPGKCEIFLYRGSVVALLACFVQSPASVRPVQSSLPEDREDRAADAFDSRSLFCFSRFDDKPGMIPVMGCSALISVLFRNKCSASAFL